MGNRAEERDARIRKKVGAILFVVAGLCLAALITVMLMFPDSFKGGSTANIPNAPTSTQIQYEKVDLQDMLDELNTNALRAEEKYQDRYIEISGQIRIFDSDGKYIAIVPSGAPVWSIETVQCFLTDPAQKNFLLEKAMGDVVTIRGRVFSIGEVLGYSVRIAEISN